MAAEKRQSPSVLLAFVFGALCLGAVCFAAFREQPLNRPGQIALVRLIAALGAAGVGAILPGFLNVELKQDALVVLRGGGALAIFAIVYLVDPAGNFVVKPECVGNSTQECRCAGGRVSIQECTDEGRWGRCECPTMTLCEPNASRDCPCLDGTRGIQSCTEKGGWDRCQCRAAVNEAGLVPKAHKNANEDPVPDNPPRAPPGHANVAGTWSNLSTDTLQIRQTGGALTVSGSTMFLLTPMAVTGAGTIQGNSVQLHLFIPPAIQIEANLLLLQGARYMTGTLVYNGVPSSYQLMRQ
jgi:hypothetical protein